MFERGMYGRTTTSTSDEDEIVAPAPVRRPTTVSQPRVLSDRQRAQLRRQQIYEAREQKAQIPATPESIAPPKKIDPWEGAAGLLLNMDVEKAFRGMYAAHVITNPFYNKQQKQQQIRPLVSSYESGQQQYQPYKQDPKRVFVSPLAFSLYSAPIGYGMGAGLGALTKVAPITGKVATGILGGYAAYSTAQGAYEIYQTKGSMINYVTGVGSQFALGLPGFKAGYKQIGGRVEQFLYVKNNFVKGSPEAIRFKSGIKASRLLQDIKPIKKEPLDFRSVERLTPKSRSSLKEFLGFNRKNVIGGSAAAKTQVENARIPRDVDLLIQSRGGARGVIKAFPEAIKTKKNPFTIANERQVNLAKEHFGEMLKTDTGRHAIDIHGKEMYDPGKVLQFGFESKKPVDIGNYRYMKAGEQLFRKGVGGTQKETQYRWFKDIPDFIDIGESQVKSGKMSQNPFTRLKAVRGEKALDLFKRYTDKDLLNATGKKTIGKDIFTSDFIEPSYKSGYKYLPSYKTPYLNSYTYNPPYKSPYNPSYHSSYKSDYYIPSKPIKINYPSYPSKPYKMPDIIYNPKPSPNPNPYKYPDPYHPSSPNPPKPYKYPDPYKPTPYNPPKKYNYPSTNMVYYPGIPRRKLRGFYPGEKEPENIGTKYKFREFKIPELRLS